MFCVETYQLLVYNEKNADDWWDNILKDMHEYSKLNIKTIFYIGFIKIFGNSFFNSFINICSPILLSILLAIPMENRSEYFDSYIYTIVGLVIGFNLLYYIASRMNNKNQKWKNLSSCVTKHLSGIHIETANNIFRMHKHTKNSIDKQEFVDKTYFNQLAGFQELAFLVCNAIYDIISDELDCEECEVTVFQKFPKNNNQKYDTVKMIAYATKDCIIPSTYSNTYKISKKSEATNFMELFKRNQTGAIIYHTKRKVANNFVLLHGSEDREREICQYIGIPIKTNTNNVVCILQIDVSRKKVLGKNYKEVKLFSDNILKPFSSILYNAYERDRVFNTLYEVWSYSLQKF